MMTGKNNMNRPVTTLFMLMSVDGKISTGSTDELDFDADFPDVEGLREGLHQYYEIEQTTDLWSLNTGRVMAKTGANVKDAPAKTVVSFVILDNHHLTEKGVRYLCGRSKQLVIVTSNTGHPAYDVSEKNLQILYQDQLDLKNVLQYLKTDFHCDRLTIQSGGTMNSLFLREKLLDYIDIIIAPVLVGGIDTPTLADGISLSSKSDLTKLAVLELTDCTVLQNSYLRLRYKVVQ